MLYAHGIHYMLVMCQMSYIVFGVIYLLQFQNVIWNSVSGDGLKLQEISLYPNPNPETEAWFLNESDKIEGEKH